MIDIKDAAIITAMPLTREMKQLTKHMKDASSLQDKSTVDDSLVHELGKRLTRSKSLTEPIITVTKEFSIKLNNQNKKENKKESNVKNLDTKKRKQLKTIGSIAKNLNS